MQPRGNSQWSTHAILAVGLIFVGFMGVLAQTSPAVCLSTFDWMDNSRNQNPCVVAAYLLGACNNDQFTVPALLPGTHYTGPHADEQNPCQCSSITYNIVSACGLCQNHRIISWSVWSANCSTTYPGVFPPGIPDGTVVSQWAFQDLSTSNLFDVSLAQSVGDNPELAAGHGARAVFTTEFYSSSGFFSSEFSSGTTYFLTPTNLPSASTLDSSSTSTPGSSLASASGSPSVSPSGLSSVSASFSAASSSSISPLPSNPSSTNKLNTGAIAGGVVGGVIGVALIATAIIVLFPQTHNHVPNIA